MDKDRFIIKNFLSKSDCESLIYSANKENKWFLKDTNSNVLLHKITQHEISQQIHEKINKMFEYKYHVQLIRMIHKTTEDSFWEEHFDNSDGKVRYGIIIYLNDNFEGGELKYSDLTIKPEVGMLVCHSGEIKHKVSKVLDGDRYSLTTFLRDDK
jgi:predicted 2-oxoglutarate/Fe(II)-dependent dioxygenase YbiX